MRPRPALEPSGEPHEAGRSPTITARTRRACTADPTPQPTPVSPRRPCLGDVGGLGVLDPKCSHLDPPLQTPQS